MAASSVSQLCASCFIGCKPFLLCCELLALLPLMLHVCHQINEDVSSFSCVCLHVFSEFAVQCAEVSVLQYKPDLQVTVWPDFKLVLNSKKTKYAFSQEHWAVLTLIYADYGNLIDTAQHTEFKQSTTLSSRDCVNILFTICTAKGRLVSSTMHFTTGLNW